MPLRCGALGPERTAGLLAFMLAALVAGCRTPTAQTAREATVRFARGESIALPTPRLKGSLSVEEALRARRSVRHYRAQPLTLAEVGQLLWAAQGVTGPRGERTAPSAGALYPLEVYLAASQVDGLAPGSYHYRPQAHVLELVSAGDRRLELYHAALDQDAVRQAPAVVVMVAVFRRTTVKYGSRGVGYVYAEAGAAAQNVYLQAQALGLGTVYIGAFRDEAVQAALSLPAEEQPLVLLPVGRP